MVYCAFNVLLEEATTICDAKRTMRNYNMLDDFGSVCTLFALRALEFTKTLVQLAQVESDHRLRLSPRD